MMPHPDEKDVTLEWYRSNVQFARDLSIMALKTLLTLNSGAFVVLLTFIGNAAAQSAFSVPIESLQTAMYWFLAGIVLVFLVIAFAYVNMSLMSPYDHAKGINDRISLPIYIIFSGGSLMSFIFGVFNIVSNVVLP